MTLGTEFFVPCSLAFRLCRFSLWCYASTSNRNNLSVGVGSVLLANWLGHYYPTMQRQHQPGHLRSSCKTLSSKQLATFLFCTKIRFREKFSILAQIVISTPLHLLAVHGGQLSVNRRNCGFRLGAKNSHKSRKGS